MILLGTTAGLPQDGLQDRVVTQAVLDIDPVEQQTLEWCWLSMGEMIFTYLDLDEPPSGYQCGTMAMIGGRLSSCWQNCALCPYAAGTMPTLERMIRDYPRAIAAYQEDPAPLPLTLSSKNSVLDWDEVETQISQTSPIVAAVNPFDPHKHVPQHVTLIVGFKEEKGKQFLLVNDPAPYDVLGIDPYGNNDADKVQDFQYWIEYDKFKDGLAWNYSAYAIHDPSHHKKVSDLGISFKYETTNASAAAPTPATTQPADPQVYLPLDQTLSKWIQESPNNFADNKIVTPLATFATPGFDYLGDKRQCEITDPDSHQCVFSLYGKTDSGDAQSHYSRLDGILTAAFPDWSTTDIPSPVDVAGGHIRVLRKRTRSKDNFSIVLDKETFIPQQNDVGYYMVDLTFV
jgi:hypothetical protein